MLLLTSSQDVIHLVISPPITLDVHASYLDHNGTTTTPGRQNTQTTTETDVDVVNAPSGTVKRSVKTLHVRNAHATDPTTVQVQHKGGGVTAELRKVTLLAGEKLAFVEGQGFRVYDADGAVK